MAGIRLHCTACFTGEGAGRMRAIVDGVTTSRAMIWAERRHRGWMDERVQTSWEQRGTFWLTPTDLRRQEGKSSVVEFGWSRSLYGQPAGSGTAWRPVGRMTAVSTRAVTCVRRLPAPLLRAPGAGVEEISPTATPVPASCPGIQAAREDPPYAGAWQINLRSDDGRCAQPHPAFSPVSAFLSRLAHGTTDDVQSRVPEDWDP